MTLRLHAVACAIVVLLGGGFATACASGGHVTPATAENDDAAISARVKATLMNDPQINATKIDVATSGGVVTLSGSVRSQADADRAVQLTRATGGVKDVRSALRVGS